MQFLETKFPPPLVGIAFMGVGSSLDYLFPSFRLTSSIPLIVTLALVAIGFGFPIAGSLSFRNASTTINPLQPEKASALVTSGVFQYSRNPMYVGMAFLVLAWTSYLASLAALLSVIGFVYYISRFQIEPEERALLKIFNDEFSSYQKSVRRWL